MTLEEHKLLIENNIMLKQILAYIASRDSPNTNFKEFDTSSSLSEKIDYILNYDGINYTR